MINRDQIIQWANEALEGTDRFIVDVLVKNHDTILVFLDADSSVNIDDCVAVSRSIEGQLDREEHDFELRVSSAGADQPFHLPRQYNKNIGRSLEVYLNDTSIVTGKLTEISSSGITLETFKEKKQSKIKKEVAGQTIVIPFTDIKESKVIISFQ
ncbi:MAG: ribosome assembly cofactor RimP [Bacteroidales bacterium]|nr:ribosome assembly cofactor RimP [Bacteroidales bacterium]